MSYDEKSLISCLIESGCEAARKGLVWGASGNISHRLDDSSFMISGSGAYLEKLSENDFVIMNLEDEKWKGQAKPSIETKMHSEIYKIRKDVNAVLHSQPFFTTLISCTSLEVDVKLFPEAMVYLDKVIRVPYDHPGSSELARSVSENIKDCDIVILSNHGAICAADCLENLILKTETLEMLCKIIAFSKVGDLELNYLPQNVKDEFLKHLREIK
ncbi:MAG: class II aldolase/adducin family protein [Thermoplasmata archaeon]|nr:MAG: class II aldolase/adducin family protein [Thermoplasmata archaeon]